ncbi:MAG: carboxypeptidase-like regulatory domain-containing protein, partial [Bryobacteraceae bacterium]
MSLTFKLAVMATALFSASAFAQSGGVAGISGTVYDPSGAVVPNAQVVISTKSKGELRTVTTNQSGIFSAPALLPGAGYDISVTATGFSKYELQDVDLQVGQNLALQVKLVVSQGATQVEVSAAAP